MNDAYSDFEIADTLEHLGDRLRSAPGADIEINKLRWDGTSFIGSGNRKGNSFHISVHIGVSVQESSSVCSICDARNWCPHAKTLVDVINDANIAYQVEDLECEPCSFTLKRKPRKPSDAWKKQLADLSSQFNWYKPATPAKPSFPAGRQVVYVLQQPSGYSTSADLLEIAVVTRPAVPSVKHKSKNGNSIYRNFTAGVGALGASTDPLDQEIAEKLSLRNSENGYYQSRQQLRLHLSPEMPGEIISRLAKSGRLFWNGQYALHDNLLPIGWLCDAKLDLKFEINSADEGNLKLGVCAVGPGMVIPHQNLKVVTGSYLIDSENRLGLFKLVVPTQLVGILRSERGIVVPRGHAGELIEKVLSMPLAMGIEFNGCDDIKPQRAVILPKPMIHIQAAKYLNDTLEAHAFFDYEGTMVPLGKQVDEFYDKQRSVIVPIDKQFHEESFQFLCSLGVKRLDVHESHKLCISQKKFGLAVSQLIHKGWHVEADGKLYRTGSRFDLNVVSGIDWFELQGTAHFDQTTIDLPRLLQALKSGERSVVLDDGTVGVIPEAWLKQFSGIADLASQEDGSLKFGKTQVGLLDALLAEQGAVNVDEKFSAARESLRAFDRIAPIDPPAGFVGTLRPYQKLAQGWFEFLRTMGLGGCLADDMGLGKTIQVLSLLEHRRQSGAGPSLIVVPRSLIFNWTAEAKKFAPNIRVLDQSHSQRTRGTEHLSGFDLILTTYGTLRRDAVFLKDFEFDYVVLDEAQAIKNSTTDAAKAARLLRGRHKLALSGTPIENHLGELWSLFDFLNPGMLGRVGRFANLAAGADVDERKQLATAVRPFILRRTKKQVAPELPDRVEQTVVVALEADQRKAYDELRDYYRKSLLNKIESDGIGKSQIVILEALLRLRQAACHPGLVNKSMAGKPSAKLDELLQRIGTNIEAGDRVLVFSQFTSFLAIVKQRMKKEKIDFLYLDGKTKDRQGLVEQFQSGVGPAVFLISLKAGGVGLNLTAARSVYLLDPWWNPAVEAQAIDRSHRIGQQQAVFATRLIAADTVEQKVLELQAKKRGLADAIINADNAGISSLTKEDLELLLA